MLRAITLGARARGTTSPNPAVGAVLIDAFGEVISVGATEPPGGRHAEVVALDAAGPLSRGATLVCTLEPCAHTGRTGPCAQAIAESGVARVVFALLDPNPVAAGGADALRTAGVEVESGLLESEANESLASWLGAQRLGRPFVTWKSAQSLDARVATGTGAPVWLTSEASRRHAHETLRAKADAIIVGSATVVADDPSLTVRTGDAELDAHRPIRIVMDRSGSTTTGAKALNDAAPSRVSSAAPAELLKSLHADGVVDVLIEGGPRIGSAFHREHLVDRVVVYLAPQLMGTAGAAAMDVDASGLDLLDVMTIGGDLRLTYAVAH